MRPHVVGTGDDNGRRFSKRFRDDFDHPLIRLQLRGIREFPFLRERTHETVLPPDENRVDLPLFVFEFLGRRGHRPSYSRGFQAKASGDLRRPQGIVTRSDDDRRLHAIGDEFGRGSSQETLGGVDVGKAHVPRRLPTLANEGARLLLRDPTPSDLHAVEFGPGPKPEDHAGYVRVIEHVLALIPLMGGGDLAKPCESVRQVARAIELHIEKHRGDLLRSFSYGDGARSDRRTAQAIPFEERRGVFFDPPERLSPYAPEIWHSRGEELTGFSHAVLIASDNDKRISALQSKGNECDHPLPRAKGREVKSSFAREPLDPLIVTSDQEKIGSVRERAL